MADEPARAGRGGRRAAAAAVLVLALAAAGFAGQVFSRPSATDGSGRPAGSAAVATAPIVRTDLADTVQLAGSLGYGTAEPVINQAAGAAYTALPAPGQTVREGQQLYEVDARPVVLFFGPRPLWRDLGIGVASGPDVAEVVTSLAALGFADPPDPAAAGDFTWATAAAVERWQAALGVAITGVISPGDVVMAPGPLRIAGVTASLGQPAQPGQPVLQATGTTELVQAPLPVAQEYLVRPGDAVTITLPDGKSTTGGTVTAVAAVATAPDSQSRDASGQPGQPTVLVTVALKGPAPGLDQAPVSVNVTSARAVGVLAVPINALQALAGGGYAVTVVTGPTSHLVAVSTGLFTATQVQVRGRGLRAGDSVQVPAP
ncbi:HlyD family efflux transporter periplasmic adaptor subunit [Specibacter cremeus]|uniref:HlyD family efflux transporter periplasmic adaptor subunit n=1 Tax=Specibacter cremeus TaxID=1629051 RepID=UPI0013DE15CA|nr:HlyD family efflux transporter periplasmic adaptor subunit [Specibacter cremeus]